MIKIMLADADVENIKNFKTYIKMSFPEFKNVVSVSDISKNILEIVKLHSPKLIIGDIRFFGINSVETIRNIHEKYEDILFIIYGAYKDSEYIKHSLEFGVVDYMFKPVKPTDFHRSFLKALETFDRMEQKKKIESEYAESYKKNMLMFENIFVTNILSGNLDKEEEIIGSMKYFNINLTPKYRVFVARIDHFKKIILTLDEMEKQVLSYKIYEIISDGLVEYKHKVHLCSLNSVVVIVGGSYSLEEIIELCEKLKEEIFNKANIKITIGIGRAYENVLDIATSFREANGALRYKFNIGYNTVIPIQYVEPLNKITYKYPLEREERLVYAAVVGEYEYCIKLLKEILDSLKQCAPIPKNLLPKIIMDILISISRYATEQNLPVHNHFTTFFPSKEVLELKNIDEAYKYLSASLKNFCKYILEMRNESNIEIIKKAKDYLEKRYFESFNLSKIALGVGTTPEYLNKIFLELERKSILEYTVLLRLEEAKRLMRETKFGDDVVAVRVGYDDEKHFKSVFKQIVGASVSEYRAKNSLVKP